MKEQKTGMIAASVLVLGTIGAAPLIASAETERARLEGFQEVPPVSTDAVGSFTARIDRRADEIRYVLTYAGIESGVRFAHIHFGQPGVNGGVMVFLCDNTGGAPVVTPACPLNSGNVEGTLQANDVIGPAGQGIDPGEFDEVLEAIRAGTAYVNVHSETFPGGELRGSLGRPRR